MEDSELAGYDWIVIASSSGKDSQAMLSHLVGRCSRAGVCSEKIVVVHADLGRMEWAGTKELAREQAESLGIRFEVVQRKGEDLLQSIERRRKFPTPTQRFCTSDFKRDPIAKLFTVLARESRAAGARDPIRILNAVGMRAEESIGRAKLSDFRIDARTTGKGTRKIVHVWLPIHRWTIDEVWSEIRRSGVPHHPAYDLGMPRLSCIFCIFAPKAVLMVAGRHNPELLDEYIAVEERIDHKFKPRLSLGEVKAAIDSGEEGGALESWNM